MCGGSDINGVLGGLIVALAMLVWAFTSSDHASEKARHHEAPRAAVETSVAVSLDPLALEVRHGRISVELGL